MSPAAAPARDHVQLIGSVRAILEALILAALLWSAKALTEAQTQLAVVQTEIASLRTQLAPVPDLDRRVSRLEALAEARGTGGH